MRLEAHLVPPTREQRIARSLVGSGSNWWRHMQPLIGPRMRLPQAKDVPEDVILEVLRRKPGRWHTHHDCNWDTSLPRLSPVLAAFPAKVLHAKLASMKRRGIIDGYPGFDSRGDWHVAPRARDAIAT